MILRRIIVIVTFINLFGFLFLGYLSYKRPTIVYVDSNKLINNYAGMQTARKLYQQKTTAWQANIDTLTMEVNKQILRHEKENGKMTFQERQLSLELIHTKQKQLKEYQQALNTQAKQEDSKLTAEVIAQINAFIKKYGERRGYTIVMAATDYGNIAYADEGLDITDDVLDGLNKEYSGQ